MDAVLVENREIFLPPLQRDIEILIRLRPVTSERRECAGTQSGALPHLSAPSPVPTGATSTACRIRHGRFRVPDDAGIQDEARHVSRSKGVVVGTEPLPVGGERLARRIVRHVVIPRDVIQGMDRLRRAAIRWYSADCSGSPPLLIRSPVITTNAGFQRFTVATANSKFAVSCAKSPFPCTFRTAGRTFGRKTRGLLLLRAAAERQNTGTTWRCAFLPVSPIRRLH